MAVPNFNIVKQMGQNMRESNRQQLQNHADVVDTSRKRSHSSTRHHGSFGSAALPLWRYNSTSSSVNQNNIVQ